MVEVVLAVDQGTTSTRCIAFNHSGEPIAIHQLEHKQIYPKPGWVEHDPIEIWDKTELVVREAIKKAGTRPAEIAALGITNQRETIVVWNPKTGQPYHNAIVWQDVRTDKIVAELANNDGQDQFRERTGLPLATYFSGPKIKWMLDNVDGLREAANQGLAIFGNIDTWLIWNFTGGVDGGKHVTDVTNASRTLLMNLETLDWDSDLCGEMGVPLAMLPKIASSSEIYGHTKESGPFAGSIRVAGDLGDQQAAMVGQVCFEPGDAKNTYGTGCFMLLNTGEEIVHSKHGLLTTLCYKFGNEKPIYALEGSIAIAGSLVQWLRDNLKMIETAPEIENLANSVEDNGGIYFVPAFSGLFAPYWRSDARGAIVGMTSFVNRGHIARAVLEASAYQTREVLDAMNADSGVDLKSLKVDGGMVENELLMQFQADVLGVPVIRPMVPETTALGAAYAAGYAVGFWESKEDMKKNWRKDKSWQPNLQSNASNQLYSQWKKAVTRTFDWEV
jgi:glycerol kinase